MDFQSIVVYLVVDVTDDTPNNDPDENPATYWRDCIEVFFSMKPNDFETTTYVSGDWQIRCQRDAEGTADNPFIDGSDNANSQGDTEDIEFAVDGSSTGYIIEMAFSLDMLAEDSDFDGKNFRFDLQTADNDGSGRVQQAFWASSSNQQWHNTSYLGDAVLKKNSLLIFNVTNGSNNPIENAKVVLADSTPKYTDSNGKVEFVFIGTIPQMEYIISMAGYRNISGIVLENDSDITENRILVETNVKTYSVNFEVYDTNYSVLPNALVELEGYGHDSTNANGQAGFIAVLPSNHAKYRIISSGNETVEDSVSVVDRDIVEKIYLGGLFSLSFTVSDGVNPLEKAAVVLTGYDTVYTDIYGKAVVEDIVPGNNIEYSILKEGYDIFIDSVSITNTNKNLDIVLKESSYTVYFKVINSKGDFLNGTTVFFDSVSYVTDTSGQVAIPNILNGNYEYRVVANGYKTKQGEIQINSEDIVEEVELVHIYTVTFKVSNRNTNISNAQVTFNNSIYTTNTNGTVFVEGILQGSYTYMVTADDYNIVTGVIDIDSIDIVEEVTLLQISTVIFKVKGNSNPVSNATITFNGVAYQTNGSGIVYILDVESGEYVYLVEAEGYSVVAGDVIVDGEDIVETVSLTSVGLTEIGLPPIKLYPNPAKNRIYIESEIDINSIRIISLSSKVIAYYKNFKDHIPIKSINLSGIAPGVYMVKIITENNTRTQKIMIE